MTFYYHQASRLTISLFGMLGLRAEKRKIAWKNLFHESHSDLVFVRLKRTQKVMKFSMFEQVVARLLGLQNDLA